MTHDPAPLDDLAAAVADGTAVDWAALAARADTPQARDRIARLALLARIADVHAAAADAETPGEDRSAPAAPDYAPGDHWGPLRVVERLASGTFGTVYRAHDPTLARDVALKILHVPVTDAQAAVDAVSEGRLLARVRHPHVVSVYGADQHDGRVGLWMELVQGRTLEQELEADGPMPVSEVLAVGADLAQALHAVHGAGLLHRDLKTENVMRDARDGRVVLMDFSAGRDQLEAGAAGAWPATMAGSPLYLAPEVLAGATASPCSDVYALGVVLFRLLTGRFPVEGDTLEAIAHAHRTGAAFSMAEARPGVPPEVTRVVARALERDPARRIASADLLERELRVAREPRRRRSRRATTLAAVALLATAVAGAWAATHLWRTPSTSFTFAPRDWVLIADFENRTGDPVFDDVLEQALARELTSSRHVNVVPRARVEDALGLMRQAPDAPLDARRAREVSLRDGRIRAVLSGRITRVGSAFVLTTEVVDPADGGVVELIEADVASPVALLPAVREQAFRVREALGEALPALQRSRQELARVTTPSLEALQLYSRAAALLGGEAWLRRNDVVARYEAADTLLARAVAIDPGFASAWILRARAAEARTWRVAARSSISTPAHLPYAERALALVDNVTTEERYFIEGVAHRVRADLGPGRQDLQRAAQAFEALLQLAPDHDWAFIELEPLYRRLGRTEDAERVAISAAAVRPNSIRFAAAALRVNQKRRDSDGARQTAVRALALVPPDADRVIGDVEEDLAYLRMWEARDAWLDTDVTRLAALLEQYERDPVIEANRAFMAWTAHAWFGMGRFAHANRLIERLPPDQATFQRDLSDAYREAWDVLRPRLLAERRNFAFVNRYSYVYAWAGLTDVGEWLAQERVRRSVRMNWKPQQEFLAHLRVAQGRHAEALQLFEPLLQDTENQRLRMHELVAIARHGVGDREGAITLLERFDADPFIAMSMQWSAHTWLGCEVRLAEYYNEAGRTADAARVAATVRAHLALADPGHPFAARLARLP